MALPRNSRGDSRAVGVWDPSNSIPSLGGNGSEGGIQGGPRAMRRYNVRIVRWEVYEVCAVPARSEDEAEEQALEIYEEDSTNCVHLDGGVESVEARRDED